MLRVACLLRPGQDVWSRAPPPLQGAMVRTHKLHSRLRPIARPLLGHTHLSSVARPKNIVQKIMSYFERYPFVKYSLVLCGVVLGGSMAAESYSNHRKKQQPQIMSLPASVAHPTLAVDAELASLRARMKNVQRRGGGVVYVVGPPGAGKTELVCQYGRQFIQQTQSFWHRFKISKPAVLYLNASSPEQFVMTLQEAAGSVGVEREAMVEKDGREEGGKEEGQKDYDEQVVRFGQALHKKLLSSKVPWLIVVDNLTPLAQHVFETLFQTGGTDWNWDLGQVVVTTQQATPTSVTDSYCVHVKEKLTTADSLSLLQKISPSTDFSSLRLSSLLQSSPLALALAASTVNIYSASLEAGSSNIHSTSREPVFPEGSTEGGSPSQTQSLALQEYLSLLDERLATTPTPDEVTSACLHLYLEAAITDPHTLHTFDLLGSLDHTHPVPASLIDYHLCSPFYSLPPSPPPPLLPDPSLEEPSFFSQLKQLLPFGNKPDPASLLPEVDVLYFLRSSPLITFKKYSKGNFELLQVHSAAQNELSHIFMSTTAPKLEQTHLHKAEDRFNRTAWFKRYRTFDLEASLSRYLHSLPGVAGAGVLSQDQFISSSAAWDSLSYHQYLHLLSHHHRLLTSITARLRALDEDFASTQFCRYCQPHLLHLTHKTTLSQVDLITCSYGLAATTSVTSGDPASTLTTYQAVLEQQQQVLGPEHPIVARTLTDMADLLFSLHDIAGAKVLLERAVRLYQRAPPHQREAGQDLELGLALSSLAVVVSSLGERERSRDLLEQALSLYQSIPLGQAASLHQRRLVANTLTDLAHAHLTLGNAMAALKYIELSVMAQPSVYPEGSPETVRALSVASLVYTLLGDQRESMRVREEAGKAKKKLDKQHLVFM